MRIEGISSKVGNNRVTYLKKLQPQSGVSFLGINKNLNQIASFTPENNGLGLPETSQGGEGCVGYEAIASLRHKENVDARSFMPFWEYNNPKGGFKFLIHKHSDYPQGVEALPDTMPASSFYSADFGDDIETVAKKLKLEPSELSYVIQSKPNGNSANSLSKYCIIEPTSVKGKISRMADDAIGKLQDIPYALFKISSNNPSYNKLKGEPHYFVYTPQLARASKPYSYDANGNGPFESEIINSDWMRVQAEITHSKLDTPEFENFNPANVWCHDRVAHSYGVHIANISASGNKDVNGLKVHITAHNTGRNYQGITGDPFKMLRIVADSSDVEALKNMPEFPILEKASQVGIDNVEKLTPREHQIAWDILGPYLYPFKDGAGTYNILKTGISAVKANPQNISTGTVSYTFDKEMKSLDTPDAAKYLTGDYAAIDTYSVVNGSTPANLALDNPNANFGRGNNGLSEAKAGFTTFKYDGTNIKEVIKTREKNAKWFTKLIYNAYQKGQDELDKVFFNEEQLSKGQRVLGYLKPMKSGDRLVMGWGRPDEQKGFNITLGGFKKFLERTDIPQEEKLRFRLVAGAGKWNEDARDYKSIVNIIHEIETMNDGLYKGLVMYVDGFFPNRLVGCAQYGMFTSRREMCGITPLECKAAGVPYGATKTGGPVDYTNSSNGFLTKEAVEGPPEKYGLTWANSADEIDDARCSRQMEQVSDIFAEMSDEYSHNKKQYIAKCKKNIEEKVDWHENSEYNLGKSANRKYLDDIFEVQKPISERNQNPLNRVVGSFGKIKDQIEERIIQSSKNSRIGKIILVALGIISIGAGGYYILHKNTRKQTLNKVA